MLLFATIASNVGTWMNDVGAGWLMTELSPSPLMVAAVQAATTLPIFLFALLAGAIADIVNRRTLLLGVNALLAGVAAALAIVVAIGAMTPLLLIGFTFLLGTGAAFLAPAWQAIVPQLVPRAQLGSAIALNAMGVNVSRAIGPALAGFLIVAIGIWSPFALNAASYLIILAALWWWKPPHVQPGNLPPEHVAGAIRAGLRYAMHSMPFKATLLRAGSFFAFASAYWATLPLIARQVLEGGPALYGFLLAAVGAGAVGGAFILPAFRRTLGADRAVVSGTIGTALALALLASVPDPVFAILASILAGVSWIAVLSSLHVAAQTALPDWVRARGLSIFLTVFFGTMAGGALVWGSIASMAGIPVALLIAAAGALVAIPLTWKAKLGGNEAADLTPSGHWPEPVASLHDIGARRPVMVQIGYKVAVANQPEFLTVMADLRRARQRGGGYGWTLLEDAEAPDCFIETWFEASWSDHLRHHERVSRDDQKIQERIAVLDSSGAQPQAKHFVGFANGYINGPRQGSAHRQFSVRTE